MGRYDATKAKNISMMKKLEAHVMVTRHESIAYFRIYLDVTKSLEFMEKYNKDRGLDKSNRLTFFHIFLTACARGFGMYPQLNRFILGRKFWQRNRIQFSFLVKKKLKYKAKETLAKIDFDPFDTVDTVRERIHKYVNRARTDKGGGIDKQMRLFAWIPRSGLKFVTSFMRTLDYWGLLPGALIEDDPMYTGAMMANLGSIGLDASLHHIFNWGTMSWCFMVGNYEFRPVADKITGELTSRKTVLIGCTVDERIGTGMAFILGLKKIQEMIINPEQLLTPPYIPRVNLDELALVDWKYQKKKRKKRARNYDEFKDYIIEEGQGKACPKCKMENAPKTSVCQFCGAKM
jgi:hypothetical protein